MTTAPVSDLPRRDRLSWRADVRLVSWWLALGAATGALAGCVIGGIGGRLLMLVLRLQSPGAVGLISDDGFEIGQVTVVKTLNLMAFGASAGAIFGALYVLLRLGLPAAARMPAATLIAATVGGTAFLDPDGVDLLVLEPLSLAVAGFIGLPALSALVTAVLVERWAQVEPWSISWRSALPFAPAVLALPAAPILAVGAAAVVVGRRVRRPGWVASVARPAITALICAVVVVQGLALIREVDRIL